jgi:hypothetical protein
MSRELLALVFVMRAGVWPDTRAVPLPEQSCDLCTCALDKKVPVRGQ